MKNPKRTTDKRRKRLTADQSDLVATYLPLKIQKNRILTPAVKLVLANIYQLHYLQKNWGKRTVFRTREDFMNDIGAKDKNELNRPRDILLANDMITYDIGYRGRATEYALSDELYEMLPAQIKGNISDKFKEFLKSKLLKDKELEIEDNEVILTSHNSVTDSELGHFYVPPVSVPVSDTVDQIRSSINSKCKNNRKCNTVHDNSYKEKEINKEKESNTAGQGSLRNDGVSISSLTNEGNNFIQSEGERDRQGIDVTVSLSSKSDKEKNKSNTSKDLKDSQNTGLHSNLHQAIAPFRGESDSEPHPQVPLTPSPTEKSMTKDIATAIIKNLGDWYADGAEIVEHEPHKFMIELQHEIPFLELTNIIPDYIMRHGMDIKDIIILRQDDGKCCSKFEMYFNQPGLDNCVLSDDNLPNEQEYQNIEKCRQEAPYAILSDFRHQLTSEPMVMYGT